MNTYKINDTLECYHKDLPTLLTWEGAKIACEKLGDGWRLPTKDELNLLYENKDKIGGFVSDYYWSSSEYDSYLAWFQYFSFGGQYNNFKATTLPVRAVRTIEEKQ